MALETQTIAVAFTGGLDTKSDEKVVIPTKLIELDNGEFTKQGTVRARPGTFAMQDATVNGTTVLGVASPVPVGNKLAHATRGDELLLLTDERIYSADETTHRWIDRRTYCPMTHTVEEIAHVSAAQDDVSVAVAGNVRAAVWTDSRGGVRYSVFNDTTGAAYLLDQEADATASRPWAVPVGDNVLLVWADHSTSAVRGLLVRSGRVLASLAAPPVQFVSDLASSRRYAVTTDGTDLYFAYQADGSVIAAGVGLTKADVFGGVFFKTSVSLDAPVCLDVATDATQINVVWSDTLAVQRRLYSLAGVAAGAESTISATVNVVRVACGDTGSGFTYAWEENPTTNDKATVTLFAPTGQTTLTHSHLVSSGFRTTGTAVFLVGHDSRTGLQNGYYLYTDTGSLQGQLLYQTAVDRPSVDHLARVFNLTVALGVKRALDTVLDAAVFTANGIALVRFDTAAIPTFADVGGTTYLSGSCLWAYDGQGVSEAVPLMFPDMLVADLVSSNGAGGLTVSNQYSYRVYYNLPRANGEVVRSAALTVSVTLGASDDTVTLTIPTLSHTRWRDDLAVDDPLSDVFITVFRTAGNDEAGLFQQVTSDNPVTITGANRFLYNDPTVNSVTFLDEMTDTVRESKAVDYISRGEVEHIAPPGPAVVTAVADRVFLAGGGIPKGTIQFSLLRFSGEPAVFNDAMVVDDLPELPGAITALSYVNETLVAFREFGISALAGVGPDNTLTSGGFESQQVTTDVGGTGTTVVVPAGIMFASSKGIYLLDQSFNVGYIGAPVEKYNAQTFTGACVIPGTNQVIFVSTTGRSLMYDYHFNEWAAWTLLADSLVLWKQTTPTYLRIDGTTLYRDMSAYEAAVFTDDSSPYPFVSRTGPLRVQDVLQGFARLRKFQLLGTFRSSHRLQIDLFYDRETAPFETLVFDPATVIDPSTWGSDATWGSGAFWGGSRDASTYQFEHKPRRQKFSTISFRFSMTPVGTPGAGYELTELALECGVKPGLQRHAATRKF